MSRKKRRTDRSWWRKQGVVRRAAFSGSLVAAVVLVIWIFVPFGGSGEGGGGAMSDNPATGAEAPAFTLPTAAGGEVSLTDHLGQNAVLLYFNEGVG